MRVIDINGRLATAGSWDETSQSEADAQSRLRATRTGLRAMLAGNEAFHVDPMAEPKPVRSAFQRIMEGDLSDDEYSSLVKMRGGCGCGHPNACPPCHNCTSEITEDEAKELAEFSTAADTPAPAAQIQA